ncbi:MULTISPECIES: acyl-CoA reductase [unclassified Shewanella]|uniref:acyl-CoA reductase n=1 Tax=Shewanella TaxID=22 RepID=UPI001C73991C|nr:MULTISPECIES: acyl-CoA reductase [unclassified Shewanella]MCU8023356.1 acyl-CoA reductase [Shewanella sp. SM78]MCU8030566.1 acyl-CoA reductase [Shewanella sp. SM73]MCU8080340.1 acyl-CoA reductase [Shewanella sp. SM103]QYX63544.1 acyl-CoA reductase [Shewanella putrefaciens]
MQRYISINQALDAPEVEHLLRGQTGTRFNPVPLACFAPVIREFLADLSQRLQQQYRMVPELAAFGFWLRPRQVEQQVLRLSGRAPLGMVFHLVPSNVPTIAFYSWIMALLMGNSSIIRLSSRKHPTQEIMLELLSAMLLESRWSPIAERTRFIRYQHNDEITKWFSEECHLRVIWGGDKTIRAIRQLGLSATAQELVFPDRRSMAIIDSQWVSTLDTDTWASLVSEFKQDCTLFDQKACSSPTMLVWIGQPDIAVKQRLLEETFYTFGLNSSLVMERLVQSQMNAAIVQSQELTCYKGVSVFSHQKPTILDYTGPGLLTESVMPNWQAIRNTYWDIQTCVYLGESLAQCRDELNYIVGRVDRVVKPGQALAFDWYWDGIDILHSCSRKKCNWGSHG